MPLGIYIFIFILNICGALLPLPGRCQRGVLDPALGVPDAVLSLIQVRNQPAVAWACGENLPTSAEDLWHTATWSIDVECRRAAWGGFHLTFLRGCLLSPLFRWRFVA